MIVKQNEPMSRHTTFKIGGKAETVFFPSDKNELVSILTEHPDALILGNGSNMLINDTGISGTVIITTDFNKIQNQGNKLLVMAGASLSAIAVKAMESSLSGAEFLYGIPGTLGGAIFMNAGAFGGEIAGLVKKVTMFSVSDGIVEKNADDMNFGYRKSILQSERLIVISALLELEPGDRNCIKNKMDDYISRRRASQPLEYPSAGSTFKRPAGSFAGKLIEESGLKGYTVGGASVSEKHAGFIINKGGATASDVMGLVDHIKNKVYADSGIMLEEEIRIV